MVTYALKEMANTLEFNAYQIEIETNRKCRKRTAERIFEFLIFFQSNGIRIKI